MHIPDGYLSFNASVREELAFGPLQLELPQAEVKARVDSLLALLELEALADRPPHKLITATHDLAIVPVIADGFSSWGKTTGWLQQARPGKSWPTASS
ncbi:P-loop containing nucleoside triphosphate hydrolase [Moorella glycerini]|nr:P-loop containing nucleoside triphosphate hydrolase [Moorella glycerini]